MYTNKNHNNVNLIAYEGIDCCGKSTYIKQVKAENEVPPLFQGSTYGYHYLSFPAKNTRNHFILDSYLKGKTSLPGNSSVKIFVDNYHEEMNNVLASLDLSKIHNIYMDRSWISTIVYNTERMTNTQLINFINTNNFHYLDHVELIVVNNEQLISNMNKRLTTDPDKEQSIFESKGTAFLLKLQDYYIDLVDTLQRLGFIENYRIVHYNNKD